MALSAAPTFAAPAGHAPMGRVVPGVVAVAGAPALGAAMAAPKATGVSGSVVAAAAAAVGLAGGLRGARRGGRRGGRGVAASARGPTPAVVRLAASSTAVVERRSVGAAGRAAELVARLWQDVGLPKGDAAKEAEWLDAFAPDAVIEDLYYGDAAESAEEGVKAYLANKASCDLLVIDRLTDGSSACGFTWHLEESGQYGRAGIRGTTFVELDEAGRIVYLREVCEPLLKNGEQLSEVLAAAARVGLLPADGSAYDGAESTAGPDPPVRAGAAEMTKWIVDKLNAEGGLDAFLSLASEDVVYEDFFFYEDPMNGKGEMASFFDRYSDMMKMIRFVPERFSDGKAASCWTWRMEVVGAPAGFPTFRGMSYYDFDGAGNITYVRDATETILKPPPLQAIAAQLRPALRVLAPRKKSPEARCGDAVEMPAGAILDPTAVMQQTVVTSGGEVTSLGAEVGDARGAVVVFLRHLGDPYCWAQAREWSEPATLQRLESLGLAGPIMVSLGTPEKLRKFLELNPTVPADRIFVDDSEGCDSFKAMGFGKIGDRIPENLETLNLRFPNLGFDPVSAFNFLSNGAWLSPVKGLTDGIPEALAVLGGTLAFTKERMLHASADRLPGDYLSPDDVLDDAEALL